MEKEDNFSALMREGNPISSEDLSSGAINSARLSVLENKILSAAMVTPQRSFDWLSFFVGSGQGVSVSRLTVAACCFFFLGLMAGEGLFIRVSLMPKQAQTSILTLALASPWQALE